MEATSYPDNPALEVYVTYKQFDKRLIYWDFCQTSTKKNREFIMNLHDLHFYKQLLLPFVMRNQSQIISLGGHLWMN